MENKVIRNKRYVRTLGIVTIVLFLAVSIFFGITEGVGAGLCFLPFVVLGLILLLAYGREKIIIGGDTLTSYYLFKKTQVINYRDIRCLLLVPLSNQTSMVLVDRKYNRIRSLDYTFDDLDILFDVLVEKGIDIIDFSELVENKKNVSKYLPVLNWIEMNYYKSIFEEIGTSEKMQKALDRDKIERTKKRLKILGWVFIFTDVLAFIVGGKTMYVMLILVILAAYTLYIWYYPYIYIEVTRKNAEDGALQLPLFGALIAALFNLFALKMCGYDFAELMKFCFISACILLVPFVVKSIYLKIHQRLSRVSLVVFASLFTAYVIAMPLNLVLTFGKAAHEEIVVLDKDVDTGSSFDDYQLIAEWRGEKKDFNVSKSEYITTEVGDTYRVCIRKSLFGLEYYTVHK